MFYHYKCLYWFQLTENYLFLRSLLNADFASASAFISFGAVVDLATPLQLIVMAICEIVLFATNEYIGLEVLQVYHNLSPVRVA